MDRNTIGWNNIFRTVARSCADVAMLLNPLVLVCAFSKWQQDVDNADTTVACNKTTHSPRFSKPSSTRKSSFPVLVQLNGAVSSLI